MTRVEKSTSSSVKDRPPSHIVNLPLSSVYKFSTSLWLMRAYLPVAAGRKSAKTPEEIVVQHRESNRSSFARLAMLLLIIEVHVRSCTNCGHATACTSSL